MCHRRLNNARKAGTALAGCESYQRVHYAALIRFGRPFGFHGEKAGKYLFLF